MEADGVDTMFAPRPSLAAIALEHCRVVTLHLVADLFEIDVGSVPSNFYLGARHDHMTGGSGRIWWHSRKLPNHIWFFSGTIHDFGFHIYGTPRQSKQQPLLVKSFSGPRRARNLWSELLPMSSFASE